MPTEPAGFAPENGSGSEPRRDQPPVEPSHGSPIARTWFSTAGYVARHATPLKLLEWLAGNNPGGGINP